MIAGMVVTLKPGEDSNHEDTLEQLRQRSEIETGQLFGARLPLTIEATDADELNSLTTWLKDLNGIVHVDIVFASVEPLTTVE